MMAKWASVILGSLFRLHGHGSHSVTDRDDRFHFRHVLQGRVCLRRCAYDYDDSYPPHTCLDAGDGAWVASVTELRSNRMLRGRRIHRNESSDGSYKTRIYRVANSSCPITRLQDLCTLCGRLVQDQTLASSVRPHGGAVQIQHRWVVPGAASRLANGLWTQGFYTLGKFPLTAQRMCVRDRGPTARRKGWDRLDLGDTTVRSPI